MERYLTHKLIRKHFDEAIQYLAQQTPGRCKKAQVECALRKCFDFPMYIVQDSSLHNILLTSNAISKELSNWKPGNLPHLFVAHTWCKYHLDVIKNCSPSVFFPAEISTILAYNSTLDQYRPTLEYHGLEKILRHRLCKVCYELRDLIHCLYFPEARQKKAKEQLDVYKEELIQRTCHPSRVEWWTDFEEYRELFL